MVMTTTVRRFCRDETMGVSVRLPVALVDRLQKFADKLAKEGPPSSRSEAMVMCLVAGLDAFATGAARSATDCPPTTTTSGKPYKVECVDCVKGTPKKKRKPVPKPHTVEKCHSCGGPISAKSVTHKSGLKLESVGTVPFGGRLTPEQLAKLDEPKPDPDAVLAARCPTGDPACALGLMGGSCSIPAPLYIPQADGPPIKQTSRYCLVDANKLTPSHQPLKGFAPSPGYPADVQERRYDKDKAEQLKVIQVAERMQPAIIFSTNADAINGPPVVTESGIVLGGNGRAMALQLHYAEGAEETKDARKYLIEHAAEFGLNADEVKKVMRPALVRVVKVPDESKPTLATLVRRYNQSLTQGMDARTSAVAEARQVSSRALELLSDTIAPDDTLTSYLTSTASRPFVGELRADGVINQRNATQWLTANGTLNDDGRDFIQRVLVGVVLPDATLLDSLGAMYRAAIARVVPYVLATQAAEPQWHLMRPLQAAARDVVRMRDTGEVTVDEYLRGLGLFKDIKPAVEGVPLGREMLHALWDLGGSPVKIARVFREYADAARRNPRGQGGFEFGGAEPETPAQVLGRLLTSSN